MALSKDTIKTAYPLPVYNYRVEIGSEAVAFSEVSGLSISYETSVYKESPTASGSPGPRTMQMPAQRNAPTIVVATRTAPAATTVAGETAPRSPASAPSARTTASVAWMLGLI